MACWLLYHTNIQFSSRKFVEHSVRDGRTCVQAGLLPGEKAQRITIQKRVIN
ncbi:MAG: hypothetical protein ACI8XO_002671 [Verrucomicrobiales bacterium]